MKKTIGIIVAMLVLALAGGIGWKQRNSAQTRLLRAAEDIVFTDADMYGQEKAPYYRHGDGSKEPFSYLIR